MDFNAIIELTKNLNPTVIFACLIVGYCIKHSITAIDNKWIPLIVTVLGAVINCVIAGFNIETVICGGGAGLMSVGFHQLFKQLVEGGDSTSNG